MFRIYWQFLTVFALFFALEARSDNRCFQAFRLATRGRLLLAAHLFTTGNITLWELGGGLNFKTISELSLEMAEKSPPKEAFFLGLGRSPFPVTEFINLIEPGSATTIPLSYHQHNGLYKQLLGDLKKYPRNPFSLGEKRYVHDDIRGKSRIEWDENPISRENVFSLFDKFFPKPEEVKNRKLVLVDLVAGGESLLKFYIDVQEYLKARNLPYQVEIMGLMLSSPNGFVEFALEYLKEMGYSPPETTTLFLRGAIGEMMTDETHKKFAPFFVNEISLEKLDSPESISPNPNFSIFQRALKNDFLRKIKKDPKFQSRIENLRNREKKVPGY